MWTLLSGRGLRREPSAAAPKSEPSPVATPTECAEHASDSAPAGAQTGLRNGTRLGLRDLRPVDRGKSLLVAVYLHPGRARVATMAADQVAEQFDLLAACEYPSLAAAELACDDRPGFLLEISEPFLDSDGHRRNGAILFVPGLGR